MFSTKTRNTIVALVALFSVAGMSADASAFVMFGGTTSNGGGIIRSQMK
jgi:hypothetical protein